MTATGLGCRSCGTELGATAKFCSECGKSVSATTAGAEYKQVTVLFADVVHSMDIAAAVGAERLREIMAELVTLAARVVQRYGGVVDKFTGDGIMAVFGAPVALEDHAVRACLAALGIQVEVARLTGEVERCDGVGLRLRVGLNSGQVVAGEIVAGASGYTAIGQQVGMAQRMESVAPPGGVMLSDSTARLVEGAAVLGEPQLVRIKGAEAPVPARRLLSVATQRTGVSHSTLVGREWEMTALAAMLDRSTSGRGSVAAVVGPAGIGKTRLTAEAVQLAESRGIEVFSTWCESHAADVPFHTVARLLRTAGQLNGLDDQSARAQVRAQFPDADPQDLMLLDDLLGIANPDATMPNIDPDARRRRLTALINSNQLARSEPAVFVIEDAHWIDEVSESMLADFLAVIPQTPSLVLITYRPEYQGALARVAGAQSIALTPLSDAETSALVAELLGRDSSVERLAKLIAGRAAGNPFFAEEITRDLAERGVLVGDSSSYTCHTDAAEVDLPPTLQATIAARIDRLAPAAKHTLAAAAIIGSRFDRDLLADLGVEPVADELIAAELIDQVRFTPHAEYAFRHPLIRTVAYESQLKSERTRLHRRLAATIEVREPESADQNATLIAEHLEAAGDLHDAYGWHMRAATWATNRDINAARLSWERAEKIADALPPDDPNRTATRIAPRTMLCGIAWRVDVKLADVRFNELRGLCTAAGDKRSLAIAMAGLVMDHTYQDRLREASQLARESITLIESVGDKALTVGLSITATWGMFECAEWSDVLRCSQRVIDLAGGDACEGDLLFGSPLAAALMTRGIARYCLGIPGWQEDTHRAIAMARSADPMSYATVVGVVNAAGITNGVRTASDGAILEIEDAIRIAERSGDEVALTNAQSALGIALVHREDAADRDLGQKVLTKVAEVYVRRRQNLPELPIVNAYVARERFRRGDRHDAISHLRAAADHLFREGRLLAWGVPATGVLVETLLDRGADGDVVEAEAAVERLATAPTDDGFVVRDVLLLRLRALLARARGDVTAYTDLRDRYRHMAKRLGFEGHIAWAEAMP